MIKRGIKETTSVVERQITVLYTFKIQIQIQSTQTVELKRTSKKKGEERHGHVCRVREERQITVLYTSIIQIQSTQTVELKRTSKKKGDKAYDKMIKRGIQETTSVVERHITVHKQLSRNEQVKKKEKRDMDMYVESEKRDK
jgi:hypothetical protein